MSLRFDHYLSTNGTSSSHSGAASSAQLIQAAASFMQEHFAGAFPELAKDPNQKPQAPSKSKAHKAADTKQTPAQLSPAPRLLAQSKRISLYRSYQTKLRRAWHDAKPADLVQLDTDLRSELQSDTAIVHMVHRSILGETLLDCLSMSYQMTRVDPVGVPQVTYSRGARNGRCLRIPSNPEVADQIANPFRSNGSLMVTFTLQILSRTPQLLPSLPPALRQILFTCCLRTIFAEVCAEEAHASYEAAYCSLGRNLDSILILLLHIALLDPEVCRKVVCNHRIRSAAADDHFQG